MKKWWFHRVACVCNLVSTTIVLIFIIYGMFTSNGSNSVTGKILGLFSVSIGYFIYILSDIWGLKLYHHYKKLESLSISDKRKYQVSFVFLIIIQIVIGGLVYDSMDSYVLYFKEFEIWSAYRHVYILFPVIFLSSIVVAIGCVLLLNAIDNNKILIKNEIEAIGKNAE